MRQRAAEACAVAAGCALVVGGGVALGALSLAAHAVARVAPPAPVRGYIPVEARVMFAAPLRRRSGLVAVAVRECREWALRRAIRRRHGA